MSLLLLFGGQGAEASGAGTATLTLGATGTGKSVHYGTGIAALALSASGVGQRPADPGVHQGSGIATLVLGAVGVGRRPAVTVDLNVFANLGAGGGVGPAFAWHDLASDIIISSFGFSYGLTGNRPTDSLAGSGALQFSVRNDAHHGHPAGWYSPLHASCRPGWTAGIEIFVWLSHYEHVVATGLPSGTFVSLFTVAAHHLSVGELIRLDGATVETDLNFVWRVVSVPDATTAVIDTGTAHAPVVVAGSLTIQRGNLRFWGRIETIDPEPGPAFRRAHVTAYDRMRDLLDADLVDVALQVNKTESEILTAIFAALDPSLAPRAAFLDAGIDQVPIALDNLGDGARAGAIVGDVLRSSYGLGFVYADGIFRYISRNTRATTVPAAAFPSTMSGLSASTSITKVYSDIRTTTHPRTFDPAPVVLWESTGTPTAVPAGVTQTLEATFRDPNDVLRLIAAISTLPMAPGVDWIANSAEDGSGTDLTLTVGVTPDVRATTVVFSIGNTGSAVAYLTTLQIRGIGVYDQAPRSFTSRSTQTYGKRSFALDLPNQNVDAVGQQIADFIHDQYAPLGPQVDELVLRASPESSPGNFTQMLGREIGDVITIAEPQTGVAGVDAMILGCSFQALTFTAFEVRWRLGPVVTIDRPATPTGLTVTTIHDTALRVAWATGTAGSYTQIYLDGVYIATQGIGVTSLDITGLTRATNYSFTVRHLYFGLTSDLSAPAVGRPSVAGTGGTTFDSGGYRYHYFYSSGSFVQTVPGRVDLFAVGGGGGGGAYADWTGSGGGPSGGGGGGGGRVVYLLNEEEPAGSHPIAIGAGGIGAATIGQNGAPGGVTTYRIDHIIAAGGGRGAGAANGPNSGGTGGSGGGAAGTGGGSGGNNVGGAGLGFNGGNGGSNPGGAIGGGGGGGAGGLGGNGSALGGAAGAPHVSPFNGVIYAGGGVGGRGTAPAAGLANSGTGGGGGQESHNTGYAGGSGFFAVKYPI